MQVQFQLPPVDPERFPPVECCRTPHCDGKVVLRQTVPKRLVDTEWVEVDVLRYLCTRCGHFRVYPTGVSREPTSKRIKTLAVLLYLLGLSYGEVSTVLFYLCPYRTEGENAAWYDWTERKAPLSKTAVYHAVRAAGERVQSLRAKVVGPATWRWDALLNGRLRIERDGDLLLIVGVRIGPEPEVLLTSYSEVAADAEQAASLIAWVEAIAAVAGAKVLVWYEIEGRGRGEIPYR
jgi:hypothetical protein